MVGHGPSPKSGTKSYHQVRSQWYQISIGVACQPLEAERDRAGHPSEAENHPGQIGRRSRGRLRRPGLDAREVCEVFEVLGSLERMAAELAAERMTALDLARLRRLQQRIEQHHRARRRHEYFRQNHALHEAIVALSGDSVLQETPCACSPRAAGPLHGDSFRRALGRVGPRARRNPGGVGKQERWPSWQTLAPPRRPHRGDRVFHPQC